MTPRLVGDVGRALDECKGAFINASAVLQSYAIL